MVEYYERNPSKMLPLDYYVDCNVPDNVLQLDAVRIDKTLNRLLQRARAICESRIVTCALKSHTNPATTIFYLKNRFGYIDKTEPTQERTGGVRINIRIGKQPPIFMESGQVLGVEPEPDAPIPIDGEDVKTLPV